VRRPAAPASAEAVGRLIGRTARRLREEQDLRLIQVAERARISPGMLSRLETGGAMPSLATLVALAEALGVSVVHLFRDTGVDDNGAQLVQNGQGLEVVRRGTRKRHTYHLLAAQRGPKKVFEPFLVTLTDKSEVFPEFQHPGTEFIFILTGSLTYRHGTQSYPMNSGDALTFRGDVPHGPESLDTVPIRMLSIIMYAEE
jgi:transcriptional regulator with XRE-family HTH domain